MPHSERATTAQQRCRLFTSLLDRASRLSGLSRKQLAQQMSVSVGTVNAYLVHRVDPLNTRLVIQQRLAALNGLDLTEVMALYETGDWDALPRRQPQLLRHVHKPLRPSRSALGSRQTPQEWSEEQLPSSRGVVGTIAQLVPA